MNLITSFLVMNTHQRCLQERVKIWNEPKQVMPNSPDLRWSLEIKLIWTFDTEFPTFFNLTIKPFLSYNVYRSPPAALMLVLETGMAAVQMTLADLEVGENMLIEAYIEEHVFAAAYLLSWQLLLAFFKAASAEVGIASAEVGIA